MVPGFFLKVIRPGGEFDHLHPVLRLIISGTTHLILSPYAFTAGTAANLLSP
jgi:hypothetical protein